MKIKRTRRLKKFLPCQKKPGKKDESFSFKKKALIESPPTFVIPGRRPKYSSVSSLRKDQNEGELRTIQIIEKKKGRKWLDGEFYID